MTFGARLMGAPVVMLPVERLWFKPPDRSQTAGDRTWCSLHCSHGPCRIALGRQEPQQGDGILGLRPAATYRRVSGRRRRRHHHCSASRCNACVTAARLTPSPCPSTALVG